MKFGPVFVLKKAFKFHDDPFREPFVEYWVVSRSGLFRQPETYSDEIGFELVSLKQKPSKFAMTFILSRSWRTGW